MSSLIERTFITAHLDELSSARRAYIEERAAQEITVDAVPHRLTSMRLSVDYSMATLIGVYEPVEVVAV